MPRSIRGGRQREPEPLLVPLVEPEELGEVVLPEEPEEDGPQSFIADFASAELLLLPSVFDVPLLLVLEPGLVLLAAEPFGPQSGFAIVLVVPDVEPAPDLEPTLVSVPAVPVLLVCAMAAPPSANASAETAVRRRRFIGGPPCLLMGTREAVCLRTPL
jgi:hypothetical protein